LCSFTDSGIEMPCDECEVRALFGQGDRAGGADAFGATGDETGLLIQLHLIMAMVE